MTNRTDQRAGFSLIEFQVSLVLFSIALAGLGPLVVVQSRQLLHLERHVDDAPTYFLVPAENPWARKLGAAGQLRRSSPSVVPDPILLVDNLSDAYRERDLGRKDWSTVLDKRAHGGHYRRNGARRSFDFAHWEFVNLPPGWYEVLVTYPAHRHHATNAPFTVYAQRPRRRTVRINQQTSPGGPEFAGQRWDSLGLFSVTNGRIRVRLFDRGDGVIAADAVRVEPIRNELRVLSFEESSADPEELTAAIRINRRTP